MTIAYKKSRIVRDPEFSDRGSATMTFHAKLLASTALLGIASLMPYHAQAGLLGASDTVQAFYYNGVLASPEGEIPDGAGSDDPAPLASPVTYEEGTADLSGITVGDTQITITNMDSGFPFCVLDNAGTACADPIDGFDFLFTGENINSVSVDAASAADFQPVTGTFQGNTHLGLQLISPDEIRVDVTGDQPLLDDQLILDVTLASPPSPPGSPPPPPGVPEPATLALLGSALAGLGAMRRRKR
jgi:hypothetical protein